MHMEISLKLPNIVLGGAFASSHLPEELTGAANGAQERIVSLWIGHWGALENG